MFRRVLLATDFSENARVAYRWAAALARGSAGRVVLVHVLEADLSSAAPLLAGPLHSAETVNLGALRAEFRRTAEAALEAAAQEVRTLGVEVETRLVEGVRPWQAIVQAARDFQCGVIALSTHGRSGLAHLLIGSTAEKVVRTAHCPVLTVHEGDRAPA